jgi:hypothetical protein
LVDLSLLVANFATWLISLFLLQILQLCWSLFFVCIFFWGGFGLLFVVICLFIYSLCFLQFFWIFFLVLFFFVGLQSFQNAIFLELLQQDIKEGFSLSIILYNPLYKCNK